MLKVIFEDKYLIVLEKPAGLVIHPGAGQELITLSSLLAEQFADFKKNDWPDKTRPGLVHRLDKDTSGLMVVAKTPVVLELIQNQFRLHLVDKIYWALVYGDVKEPAGEIEVPIGRDRKERQKMKAIPQVWAGKSRASVTQYRVIGRYLFKGEKLTLLELKILTGRTHQIRVHLKYWGYPVMGDNDYFFKPSRRLSKTLGLQRQFLHAKILRFTHPITKKRLEFESSLPDDLQKVLVSLDKK